MEYRYAFARVKKMLPELRIPDVRKMVQEMDIYGLISIDNEDRDWERTPPRLVKRRLGND